jgi:toxin ParE1/3/4
MTGRTRRILPAADVDIDEQVLFYFGKEENLGLRFFQAVQITIDNLAEMPAMGSPLRLPRIDHGLRKWPVLGFPRVLVFYREVDNGVEIIRVLHARQNWRALFDRSA